jgi:hypothetical protein
MQTALGDVLRDEAIDRVESHNTEFVQAILAHIAAHVAISEEHNLPSEFTSDDLWGWADGFHADMNVTDPRAMGAAIREAVRCELIEPTGSWIKSKRSACHCRPVREWRGKRLA